MNKPYSRRVFSGKEIPFIGIHEGVGELYRGQSVEFSVNLFFLSSMSRREGGIKGDTYSGDISNSIADTSRTVCEGNNIWSEPV